MKKTATLCLFALFLMSTTDIFSQKLPVRLGLRVAPALSWMNPATEGYDNNGVKPGITIGFVSDIYFAERYAFSTGFDFAFLNGKLAYSDSVYVAADGKVHNGNVDRTYKFIYFEIPLAVKMKTRSYGKFTFFAQIGFTTGFRIKATATDIFTPDLGSAIEQDYNLDRGTTLIRESIIAGIGGELDFDKSSRLVLGINYSNALNNVLKGTNYKSGEEIRSTLNFLQLNIAFLF